MEEVEPVEAPEEAPEEAQEEEGPLPAEVAEAAAPAAAPGRRQQLPGGCSDGAAVCVGESVGSAAEDPLADNRQPGRQRLAASTISE